MLRKIVLGMVAVVALLVVATGTASAHGYYHGGYGHHGCYGHRGGYYGGYRGYGPGYGVGVYAPPVYVNPTPGYAYPGYGYGYGYGAPGVGITTPGFGMYVR
jgi:hypothetical protein